MMPKDTRWLLLLASLAIGAAHAQDVRRHTRPDAGSTPVTNSQAIDLTLTLSAAATRPVQTWVRTAGTLDPSGKILAAYLVPPDSALVKVGQRVRAFPPDSRSSMYQAWVTRVAAQGNRVRVEATLSGPARENSTDYVMEIVTERGQFLSVPNEAIIEEGDKRVVYVQQQPGQYAPREIHTGVQGELYTQVLHGLQEGDPVVTFGSFFIDAEHKLKATGQTAGGTSNDQHHH